MMYLHSHRANAILAFAPLGVAPPPPGIRPDCPERLARYDISTGPRRPVKTLGIAYIHIIGPVFQKLRALPEIFYYFGNSIVPEVISTAFSSVTTICAGRPLCACPRGADRRAGEKPPPASEAPGAVVDPVFITFTAPTDSPPSPSPARTGRGSLQRRRGKRRRCWS